MLPDGEAKVDSVEEAVSDRCRFAEIGLPLDELFRKVIVDV